MPEADKAGKIWNPFSRQTILIAWQNHRSNQNEVRYLTPNLVKFSLAANGSWLSLRLPWKMQCPGADGW